MSGESTISKVLIAAGGTGGHILPALSVANGLKSIDDKLQVEFVHGLSNLEKDIYSRSSFVTHSLSVGRLRKNVGGKERLKTIISLPFILLKSLILIMKIKPVLVVGMGGAVSGPVLLGAFLLRKKTVIFEPNVVPGLTNRWLSLFVDEVIVVFDVAKKYFKTKKQIQFPFPVRPDIQKISIKDRPDHPLRVLVLGGSQGSSVINKVVSELIISNNNHFFFIHQTGKKEYAMLKKDTLVLKMLRYFLFYMKYMSFMNGLIWL